MLLIQTSELRYPHCGPVFTGPIVFVTLRQRRTQFACGELTADKGSRPTSRGSRTSTLRDGASGMNGDRLQDANGDFLVRRGRELFGANNFAESRNAFEAAVAADPSNAVAHYGVGMCLMRTDHLVEAALAFRRALAVDGRHADSYYQLGVLAEKSRAWEEAIDSYAHAASLQKDHAAARRITELREWLAKHPVPPERPESADEQRAAVRPAPSPPTRQSFAEALGQENDDGVADRGELLLAARRRASSYVGHWLLAILFAVAAGLAPQIRTLADEALRVDTRLDATRVHHDADLLIRTAVPVCAGIAVLIVLWVYVLSMHTKATVYRHRIDLSSGVFFQSRSSVWLYDMSDIDYERGPLLILTNTGCLAMHISAEQVSGPLRRNAGTALRPPADRAASAGRNTVRVVGIAPHRQMRDLWHLLRDQGIRDRRSVKQTLL